MVVYYPQFFPKNGNKDQTALRVKRIDIMLDNIIAPEEKNDVALYETEKEIFMHDKPNVWNAHKPGNMERVLEVDFQKFGIAVSRRTNQNIEEISTFTFYASVQLLKEEQPKK